jgi:hypothetical protein
LKCTIHNHCAGDKSISTSIQIEIADGIKSVEIKPAKGNATKIRDAILANLKSSGWSGEVAVAKGSNITVTSMKNEVGLCLQTGNMARMYADLIKLQTLYLDAAIKAAVIILPSQPVSLILGRNIAQAKRLERELEIFKKAYHVPTLIYGLE